MLKAKKAMKTMKRIQWSMTGVNIGWEPMMLQNPTTLWRGGQVFFLHASMVNIRLASTKENILWILLTFTCELSFHSRLTQASKNWNTFTPCTTTEWMEICCFSFTRLCRRMSYPKLVDRRPSLPVVENSFLDKNILCYTPKCYLLYEILVLFVIAHM